VKVGTAITSVGTLRYIASPITVEGDPQVGIYVTAVDVDAALKELTDSFTTYAIAAALACAAIGLVGWFVASRLLRPITELRAAASRITATDRGERLTVLGNDDVSAAGQTVNGMLDRLDLALTSQRQLLDDVRHELKTPITIVRGHLELLDASSPGDVESTRSLALDELDRMSGLVDDIEALADAQVVVPDAVPADAAQLTRRVFEKASGIPNHRWLLAEAAEATVDLDPRLVTQAWLQLIDNASKYSPAWSTVTIGSSVRDDEQHGRAVEFWVVDEGLGIPEGSEQRIFERFGRVDGGRGIRGSGLGLPIVMAIANAHHGTVSLTTSPQGSRFGIVVPLDPAPVGVSS
jgi:signal transduction histidine kinase